MSFSTFIFVGIDQEVGYLDGGRGGAAGGGGSFGGLGLLGARQVHGGDFQVVGRAVGQLLLDVVVPQVQVGHAAVRPQHGRAVGRRRRAELTVNVFLVV